MPNPTNESFDISDGMVSHQNKSTHTNYFTPYKLFSGITVEIKKKSWRQRIKFGMLYDEFKLQRNQPSIILIHPIGQSIKFTIILLYSHKVPQIGIRNLDRWIRNF